MRFAPHGASELKWGKYGDLSGVSEDLATRGGCREKRETEQWVKIDGDCETSQIQIEIVEVYQGTSAVWDDTCIAEIGIYGEDID